MRLVAVLAWACLLLPSAAHAEETGDSILGVWTTTGSQSQVQVFKEHGKYFGKIISLKEPNVPADDKSGMAGKPKTDFHNPKPELRQRPIVGLQIMGDFVAARANRWESGRIYDPESGKTYKCKLSLVSTNRLEVRGYVGVSLLGRTVSWTR